MSRKIIQMLRSPSELRPIALQVLHSYIFFSLFMYKIILFFFCNSHKKGLSNKYYNDYFLILH